MLFLGLVMLGVVSYDRLKVELFPSVESPQLVVKVIAPQEVAPSYMETQAVVPLEGAIGTLRGIERLTSDASRRNGTLRIEYEEGVNLKFAYLRLQEKIDGVLPTLPEGFRAVIQKIDTDKLSKQLMLLRLSGTGDVDRVRNIADEEVAPELLNVDGVAHVEVLGGREKTVEVILDEKACEANNVTPSKVRSLLSSSSASKAFVGAVTEGDQRMFVNVSAEFIQPEDIERVVVKKDGPVLLRDIATVIVGVKDETSYSRVDGKEAVSLMLINDNETNLIETAHIARAEIERLNAELKPMGASLEIQEDLAEQMESNIDEIIRLSLIGGLLAVFVLWVFLRDFSLAGIIALAIPVSVTVAYNLFYGLEISINSLTLMGMALAVGMLLDNGIVVLENIYRRSASGQSPDGAVTDGSREIFRSVIAATLTTVAVFLPFVFTSDFMVQVFGRNIGASIISTLLVSLAVALLLIPMLMHLYLKRKGRVKGKIFDNLTVRDRVVQIYFTVLKLCFRNPTTVLLSSVVAFVVSLVLALTLTSSESKEAASDTVKVYVSMPEGATLETTDLVTKEIEYRLDSLAEKKSIVVGVNEGDAVVSVVLVDDFKKVRGKEFYQISEEVEGRLKGIRGGADITLDASESDGKFGSGGGGMAAMGSFLKSMGIGGNRERILVKGADYEKMLIVAEDLKYRLEEQDFISYARLRSTGERPEAHLHFDPRLMSALGVNLSQVSRELNSSGKEFTADVKFKSDKEEYDVTITTIPPGEDRKQKRDRSLAELKETGITSGEDAVYPLDQVSNVVLASGDATIRRENQERRVELTYNFNSDLRESEASLEGARQDVQNLIADMMIPSGIAVEWVPEEDVFEEYYFLIAVAFVLIFMILASVFESAFLPLVLMFTIPLAATGSFFMLMITGHPLLNQNTLTGFLILFGVVVNNSIILIDYTNSLRARGQSRSRALMTAGLARLRPITITSLTTIVALIPLAMGDSEYVGMIGPPFAVTVIGGLAFSTVFTLVLVPTLYTAMETFLEWFRELHVALRILQLVAWVAIGFSVYFYIETLTWQIVAGLGGLLGVPAMMYFILTSFKTASAELIPKSEPIRIEIQNLVKVYGRQGTFARDWKAGAKIKKRLGIRQRYRKLSDAKALIWQVPFMVFLTYFTFFYLESSFWNFMGTLLFIYSLSAVLKPIFSGRFHLKGWVKNVLYWLSPMPGAAYFFMRWQNPPLLIFFLIITYLLLFANRKTKEVNDENFRLKNYKWYKRGLMAMVSKLPYFGKKTPPFRALDGVSFDIKQGMFGLLGPNGAGKSTLMRIVCGILEQSYGKVWINGIDTMEKREELQGLIGFLPQEFGTYENMSAYEFLDYQAILKKITEPTVRAERVEYVLKSVHLWDKKDSKIGSFSGGMKQRVGIAHILLHLPRILVVDEPTAGLDPKERIRFRNLLVELSRERVVIFSTHILEDISSSCDQVAVIQRGDLKYFGSTRYMSRTAEGKVWLLDIPVEDFEEADKKYHVVHHMEVDDKVRIKCLARTSPAPEAREVKPTLEDAYLWLLNYEVNKREEEQEGVPA
ncbi:hypothetical protein FUAX_30720 [Fulvitalea axinellae]|uniref:ABC transporter domain-containing protein n=2 Tax=Fulvitalea axinellae TaxID=1182444 RepID=A0AAU9CMQ5_9BACT|nr:hypothetical protein FUAX_30720 [Fulvitalea axinellae]